jgi:hypothetical protein
LGPSIAGNASQPTGREHPEHDADRVDRHIQRRAVAAADEVLMDLVRGGIGDAEHERGRCVAERPHQQEPEHGVLRHVRELAQEEVPVPEAGAEPGDRREREDQRRPRDDRKPERDDAPHGVPS